MRAARGVTLTECLVVVGAVGCLVAAGLPVVSDARDAADRVACAANLRRLGRALALYADEHEGFLPDCGAASALGGPVPDDGLHFQSSFDAPGTGAWPQVRQVGNQANLWLLVRIGYAEPAQFICPATADRPSLNSAEDTSAMGFAAVDPLTASPTDAESAFLARVAAGRCSYSYQNQLAHPAGQAAWGPSTTHRVTGSPGLAVLADRNPYTRPALVRQPVVAPDAAPEANSLNHHGAGQNVLYLGGHVEWHETPFCGAMRFGEERDHIYRPDAGEPNDPQNVPRSPLDSFLVP